MKIKTSELMGPALDWAVAKLEGFLLARVYGRGAVTVENGLWRERQDFILAPDYKYWLDQCDGYPFLPHTQVWAPSVKWSQGGPIIERELMTLGAYDASFKPAKMWTAHTPATIPFGADEEITGPSPLVAAMRAYVFAKLGSEVDIPEELLK